MPTRPYKYLSNIFLPSLPPLQSLQLVADLQARQEAEERRLRAERRVQKKLGVDVQAEFGRCVGFCVWGVCAGGGGSV